MEAELGARSCIWRQEVEELVGIEKVQILFLGEKFETGRRVDPPVHVGRKIVKQRGDGVKLDRVSPIRRRHERPLPNPEYLAEKGALLLARPNVLDYGVRKDEVERLIVEGQRGVTLQLHIPALRENALEDIRLLEARGGNLLRIWIEGMQEVVARLFERAVGAHLEYSPVRPGRKRFGESAVNLGLLVSQHPAEHPTGQRLVAVVDASMRSFSHCYEFSSAASAGSKRLTHRRRRARNSCSMPKTKKTEVAGAREESLCVIIPCLNEEFLVRRAVEEVLGHADALPMNLEVLTIDDGSSDGTRAVMAQLCAEDPRCRMITHDKNRGLGRCVTEAYRTIEDGTWVTVFPGDSEFVFPESIDNLLAARHGHDVVLGYLYNSVVRKLGRRIASTAFLKLTKTLYGFRWRALNGMKLYKVEAFKGIHTVSGGHAYVAELLAKAQLRRPELQIAEAPFISRGRSIGDSHAIKPRSVLRAVHETYKGANDVAKYREKMVALYQEELLEKGVERVSFFPPPTGD